jgi:hypothetical protein
MKEREKIEEKKSRRAEKERWIVDGRWWVGKK